MGVPMDAFKLLSADNDEDAIHFANHLDGINNERKGVVAALVKEVKKTIKERFGCGTRHEQCFAECDRSRKSCMATVAFGTRCEYLCAGIRSTSFPLGARW
jgi:hypothetical protein